ncbi:MAG: S1 family peptidase [Syntrophothermus sp.]
MKKKNFGPALFFLIFSITSFSCSTMSYKEAYPTLLDGRYDSEFPYKSCSPQLEEISESIKFLNCIAYYKTAVLKDDSRLTRQNLTSELIEANTAVSGFSENTSAGTATIIYNDGRRLAILTCAHVVNFEDSVFVYRYDKEGNPTPYLKSVSVKQRQSNYISDLLEENEFEIIKMDALQDIAILSHESKGPIKTNIPVFRYPFGSAKDLEWGTFVYVFGYPMGYKTLTKGLVSSPNRDKSGSFVLDAFFNRGFSGGIILAIKDGIPNFELVGMIKSIPAEFEYVMKPFSSGDHENYSPFVPYTGSITVERKASIKYGISRAVPVELIIKFLTDNREIFQQNGLNFTSLLTQQH